MENNKLSYCVLKKAELFEIWFNENSRQDKQDKLVNFIVDKIGKNEISDDCTKCIKEKVRLFCKNISEMWAKYGKSIGKDKKAEKFRSEYVTWLNAEISFENEIKSGKVTFSALGRPQLAFCEKSEYGKRKAAADLSSRTNNETELLVRAAATSARKQGNADLAVLLKGSLASPTRPSKIKKLCTEVHQKPVVFSAGEALAFLLENNFTKEQYNSIRGESKLRNCDIYPHYNEVAAAKLMCRPDGIIASETTARVPLESLLSHTTKRIVEMQKEVFEYVMDKENTNYLKCKLILSYGFDSSTGQAQFKQAFNEPSTSNHSDASLLATTIIPLRLLVTSGQPIWNNLTAQSTRFCRPVKLEYVKETKESILKEKSDLKKEIDALKSIHITISEGKIVEVSFDLYLTLIDGKVLNILTGTKSNQTCPICGSTPKDFMNITNYTSERFRAEDSNCKFGLSPLHCWIRFFEFILHLGYKCELQKWQTRSETDKLAVSNRKKNIQDAFWRELGLRVDMPKVGGFGSTNDGNTARRAFTDHEIFSNITGVDQTLIFRFKIILICLSCQYPLNSTKFETFCFQTADLIQKLYSWLPMTATVHKVLVHSKQIIDNTVLPIGYFGEAGAESRHKIYKADRLHHARKNSRSNNLLDIFNRATDTSDPLISSKYLSRRMRQQKLLHFPPEAIELLSIESPRQDINEDEENNENEILSPTSVDVLNNLCLLNEIED